MMQIAPVEKTGAILCFLHKKSLTGRTKGDILIHAVSILWRSTQEAEEVPLLRV